MICFTDELLYYANVNTPPIGLSVVYGSYMILCIAMSLKRIDGVTRIRPHSPQPALKRRVSAMSLAFCINRDKKTCIRLQSTLTAHAIDGNNGSIILIILFIDFAMLEYELIGTNAVHVQIKSRPLRVSPSPPPSTTHYCFTRAVTF